MRSRTLVVALSLCVGLFSCGQSNSKSVALLVDVSATYFDYIPKAKDGIYHALIGAQSDDFYLVSVIGDRSFSQEAIVGTASIEHVPSRRNVQLLKFKEVMEKSTLLQRKQQNTDIRGAILLAEQELSLRANERRYLVLFSDLDEDPAKDISNRPDPDLSGYTVVLSSIKRLPKDNRNPELFNTRIENWKTWLYSVGASDVIVTDERMLRNFIN